jgi:integrase
MKGTLRKPNGRWAWQFTLSANGDRRTISRSGYPTRKATALDLHEALARLGRGDRRVLVKPSTMTLGEYLPTWLEGRRHALKASTLGGYQSAVRRITEHLGHVRLADLDGQVLLAFYDRLRRQGGRPTKAALARAAAYGTTPVGRPLGSRSVQAVHSLVNQALADAVETGLLGQNPVEQIPRSSRPTHAASRVEGRCWEPTEAARFLAATRGDRWHPLWALALDSGARRGELVALRWADVDLDGRVITIARSRVLVDGRVVEGSPKSGRARRVDIGPETMAALRRWAKRQMAETGRSPFVFTDGSGQPVRPGRVPRLFRQACQRAGVRTSRSTGCATRPPPWR